MRKVTDLLVALLAICVLAGCDAATDSFPFVGGAQAEAKVTDSMSGEGLAEAVDREIGGGALKTGFQWQWGDAEDAINQWCEMAAASFPNMTCWPGITTRRRSDRPMRSYFSEKDEGGEAWY